MQSTRISKLVSKSGARHKRNILESQSALGQHLQEREYGITSKTILALISLVGYKDLLGTNMKLLAKLGTTICLYGNYIFLNRSKG